MLKRFGGRPCLYSHKGKIFINQRSRKNLLGTASAIIKVFGVCAWAVGFPFVCGEVHMIKLECTLLDI